MHPHKNFGYSIFLFPNQNHVCKETFSRQGSRNKTNIVVCRIEKHIPVSPIEEQ